MIVYVFIANCKSIIVVVALKLRTSTNVGPTNVWRYKDRTVEKSKFQTLDWYTNVGLRQTSDQYTNAGRVHL